MVILRDGLLSHFDGLLSHSSPNLAGSQSTVHCTHLQQERGEDKTLQQ